MLMVYLLILVIIISLVVSFSYAVRERRTGEWFSELFHYLFFLWLFDE